MSAHTLNKTNSMKLEIGSGTRPQPGHKHLDANPNLPELDYVSTMDAIPEPDNTFDEILSIHSIEHVSIPTARKALKEWLRVLKPGGCAVIDTPNIELNIRRYEDGTWIHDFNILTPEEQANCSLNGEPNKSLWLNFKVFSTPNPYDTHFWNADPQLLCDLCKEAGFSRVEVFQIVPSLAVRAYK